MTGTPAAVLLDERVLSRRGRHEEPKESGRSLPPSLPRPIRAPTGRRSWATHGDPHVKKGLGFSASNPPNAALVVETNGGETDIAVVELYNPVYHPSGPGVTYDVKVLENWEDSTDLGFAEAPADLAALAPSFGAAHLFIDDCADYNVSCCPNADILGDAPIKSAPTW